MILGSLRIQREPGHHSLGVSSDSISFRQGGSEVELQPAVLAHMIGVYMTDKQLPSYTPVSVGEDLRS